MELQSVHLNGMPLSTEEQANSSHRQTSRDSSSATAGNRNLGAAFASAKLERVPLAAVNLLTTLSISTTPAQPVEILFAHLHAQNIWPWKAFHQPLASQLKLDPLNLAAKCARKHQEFTPVRAAIAVLAQSHVRPLTSPARDAAESATRPRMSL
jgi:hypothetical protein